MGFEGSAAPSLGTLNCGYCDKRSDVFEVLKQKLGHCFQLSPCSDGDPMDHFSVLILGIPAEEGLAPQERFRTLAKIVRRPLAPPVVAFLRSADRQLIQQSIAAGAYDVFVETSPLEELRIVLRRATQFHELARTVERLRDNPSQQLVTFCRSAGSRLTDILQQAARIAETSVPVLLTGESGTGKELVARAIHNGSRRANRPFIGVSCSSIPDTLIESELFGHEKGAYTGAGTSRMGRFEAAQDGTIFLDEIGELPLHVQVKLLRVLQERSYERLGSTKPRPLQARVICATNRVLADMVKQGTFRLDLYYRLNTVELCLPPLRGRSEDIPLLAQTFVTEFAERHDRPARRLSPVVLAVLCEYSWPGNVRELQNVIERSVLMCDAAEICLEHLPCHLSGMGAEVSEKFEDEVRRFKRRLIYRALEKSRNNKVEAARSLGIARSSLHRLIEELHIDNAKHDGASLPGRFDA